MASSVTQISAYSATSGSALNQSTREGSHIVRETFEDRLKQWRNWMYGTGFDGKKVIMGRAPLDWILVISSYVVFLLALTAMSIMSMAIFYWVLDWNYPTLQGPSSILQTPGLSFRPQPYIDSTLIGFTKDNAGSMTPFVDQIEAYLKYYENQNQQGENFIDCSEINERRTSDYNKVCRFDLNALGPDCVKQQGFGFIDGMPCILIRLNKVFDWIPEEYTNETVPDDIHYDPAGDEMWNQWWITITCEGETEFDRENQGSIIYYPQGLPFKYFPFRNQQGYRSPLVMVQFLDAAQGVVLMISCKAWAQNIAHNSMELAGMVHFELMID